jgi:hypothetical protein
MKLEEQITFMADLHALDSTNWTNFADLHEIQRAQVVRSTAKAEVERLSEARGLPLRLDHLDELGMDEMVGMVEKLTGRVPADALEALRESGVPVLDPESKPAEIAQRLAGVIPADHPDSQKLRPILQAGGNLSDEHRLTLATLAKKHAAKLDAADGERTVDDGDGHNVPQVREAVQALREAGVPTTADDDDDRAEMTAEAALLRAGIPTR